MNDKEIYTPQEVVEIARVYRKMAGGFDEPTTLESLAKYEEIVPKNVRTIINTLDNDEDMLDCWPVAWD